MLLLSRTRWAVTPKQDRRRLLKILLTAIIAFLALTPPPASADNCGPRGDTSGSSTDGLCVPLPPAYITDQTRDQFDNDAERWLPSLRYQDQWSTLHTRYAADPLGDLPAKTTTGFSGLVFGMSSTLSGARTHLTMWAMYSRSWLADSVTKIDEIWVAVSLAVEASGLFGIAIVGALWLAAWRYMWRTTIMTLRTVSKDVAVAVAAMLMFSMLMGQARANISAAEAGRPPNSLSPGGITLKLTNGIDQLASAPADALSSVCEDVCDGEAPTTKPYDAISCPVFYEHLRSEFSRSVTNTLGAENTIEQTAMLVDDRITMGTMGRTWAIAQFGETSVSDRVGCIVLEYNRGTSARSMEKAFEAAGWPNAIADTAYQLGNGKVQDRRVIAWMACAVNSSGDITVTPEFSDVRHNSDDRSLTYAADNGEYTYCTSFLTRVSGDAPADDDEDGVFNFEEPSHIDDDTRIRPDVAPAQNNATHGVCAKSADTTTSSLPACNSLARDALRTWQGRSSGMTFSAAIIAFITQVLLLITSLFRSLGALFAVVSLVAVVPTFGPIAVAVAAFPGRSRIVREFGKRVLIMCSARALFVLQGALQAAIAQILLAVFAPDGVWGVMWIGGVWVAAAMVVHKMMKTMGVPSVMTPSGAFAVAAGSIAGGAVAWQTSKGVGQRAMGRVNKGLGLSKSARAEKNRRNSWAKGEQGQGDAAGTRGAKNDAASDHGDGSKPGTRGGSPKEQAKKRLVDRALDRGRDTRSRASEKADRVRNWRGDRQAAKTAANATPRPAGTSRSAHKRAVMARTTEQRQTERRTQREQRWNTRAEQAQERGDLTAVRRQESRERGKRMVLNGWATGIDEREAERSHALSQRLRQDAEQHQARQAERDARRALRQTQRSTRRSAPTSPPAPENGF